MNQVRHLVVTKKNGSVWRVAKRYATQMEAVEFIREASHNDDYEINDGPSEGSHGVEYDYYFAPRSLLDAWRDVDKLYDRESTPRQMKNALSHLYDLVDEDRIYEALDAYVD